MCRLKVVLFAKGRGADASSYRPNRDESQWWGRRDALVRCVAAFLFGPSAPENDSRELVLLFDEDWSRIHMKYCSSSSSSSSSSIVPTEQAIVNLWKRAASQSNGESVEIDGLSCQLVRPQSGEELPTGMDSKREILSHLQKVCSMDFLRKHCLNSSPAVILRKTNKKALMKVWGQWKQKELVLQSQQSVHNHLDSILKDLLQPESPSITQIVAGTLHESSKDELPCWNQRAEHVSTMQICLFLGAVRDMHSSEYRCLERICRSKSIPIVGIRLGKVPEFTSKILSIVAFHHGERTLGPAISTMLGKPNKGHKRQVDEMQATSVFEEEKTNNLHFVCLIPIESSWLTLELEKRDRVLWCIVRSTVACLWRSRMVGQNSNNPLSNSLTLIFSDGMSLVLDQSDLVTSLAKQHQAAPSEYQILKALVEKLASVAVPQVRGWKARSSAILEAMLTSPKSRPLCLLDTDLTKDSTDLVKRFYSMEHPRGAVEDQAAVVLIPIRCESSSLLDEMKQGFSKACQNLSIPIVHSSLLSTACQDREACTITLLQHFCYQDRLFGILQEAIDVSGWASKK